MHIHLIPIYNEAHTTVTCVGMSYYVQVLHKSSSCMIYASIFFIISAQLVIALW